MEVDETQPCGAATGGAGEAQFGSSHTSEPPTVLQTLIANDAYLPKQVILGLHCLYTYLLQDEAFKDHFGVTYIEDYTRRANDYAKGIGTQDEQLDNVSVQIMTHPSTVLVLMEDTYLIPRILGAIQLCFANAQEAWPRAGNISDGRTCFWNLHSPVFQH